MSRITQTIQFLFLGLYMPVYSNWIGMLMKTNIIDTHPLYPHSLIFTWSWVRNDWKEKELGVDLSFLFFCVTIFGISDWLTGVRI